MAGWAGFAKTLGTVRSTLREGWQYGGSLYHEAMPKGANFRTILGGARKYGIGGAAVGAGVGYAASDDHPIAGAVTGGLLGAGAGLAGGAAWNNRAGLRRMASTAKSDLKAFRNLDAEGLADRMNRI